MLRLEVVGPQNEQFLFGKVGLLFFDLHITGEGVVVLDVRGLVARVGHVEGEKLFGHGQHRFGGDAGRGGIVDAARAVAVRAHVLSREFLIEGFGYFVQHVISSHGHRAFERR